MNAPSGLVSQMGRTVRTFAAQLELGESWAFDAATYIAALPGFQALLEDSATVAELDAAHTARPWGPGSTGVSCAAGCGAYPCTTRLTLDRRQQ